MGSPDFGNGKICYIEIPASDINVSSAFYKNVFGWDVRTRGDGSVAFDDGVGQVSGTWVLNRKPHSEPGLIVHIMVDSAEETIEKIISEGGKITQPVNPDFREVYALFSDPAGNIFGIYQHRSEEVN